MKHSHRSVRDVVLREAAVEGRYLPGLVFLPTMAIAMVLLIGGHFVISGDLTIGEFVLFNTLLLQLVWPLEALGWILNLAQRAIASASRCFAWLEHVQPLAEPSTSAELPEGPVGVRFAGVRFGYGDGAEVLRDLHLELQPGEIVAVCGATGSGKTSLLQLLPRFYDPDAGAVEIGGVDVRAMRLHPLREAVGLVTQRPVLFSAPLRTNLLDGRPDASDEELREACEAAGVDAFVDELPDGYDTMIDENGSNLSAGERQLLTIARAFLSDPDLLILDEATSSVDTRTELLLQHAMAALRTDRTSFVIAHRLSTIRDADLILVMEDGAIVEQGTHDSLLASGGAYARLYQAQFSAAVPEAVG